MVFDFEYVSGTLGTLTGSFRISVWVTEDKFAFKGPETTK
jgi:hypothetical protein